MAVGDYPLPDFPEVPGIQLGIASAGIKTPGRQDLTLIEVAEGAAVAGVFTQNAFCAAPVKVAKQHLSTDPIRYLLINSGNANACTGDRGLSDAVTCCETIAELGGVNTQQVLPFSTGVIGEHLPMDKLQAAMPAAYAALDSDAWETAATAIMTTDTRPKGATAQFEFDGETIVVNGIAKGAGMIKPNMATMLGFVATNASVSRELLHDISIQAAQQTFNRITVDGDTSTNDACMLIATGKTQLPTLEKAKGKYFNQLVEAVEAVYRHLAQSIVADGEGATKFVTVQVEGASDNEEALKVAYSVAHSPLVKTALFASDPNWGRIVAAIGYAGVEQLDDKAVKVWLDDVLIVENGGRAESYKEEVGAAVMERDKLLIRIDLGRGGVSETLWTNDLSYEYIKINAEYRT